ncbi:MAG TPA: carboxypeptidase regulatory-like domain-containing protein [Terriglobia bacterium]|nr:carboxypeptidase regulatory-like domain-containing protein [Terriglobia bacterium]
MRRITAATIVMPFVIVLSVGLSCVNVWAQATAQISGTVKDQTGAGLSGAAIRMTQTDTGVVWNAITDPNGFYMIPNLAIGPYRLDVDSPGFRTYARAGIVLHANSSPEIDVNLETGQGAQPEIQANASMVETRNSSVGQVFESDTILALPLAGRNVAQLIPLAGATVQTGTTTERSFAGLPILSLAGGLGFGTAYSLDGTTHTDLYNEQSLPLAFPDAVQEFRVETSGSSAQDGEVTSVHTVTKSGTNLFHGSLFEFVQNYRFNARSYFAARRDTLKRNQFGGTLGGPIRTGKLFFFAGFQGKTMRQDPSATLSLVPTPAVLTGDWTAFTSPACNAGRQIALRGPFVNNRIAPGLYSRAAVNISNRLPKSSDPCGQFISTGSRFPEDDTQAVGRMDYEWSNKHSLFGRYVVTSSNIPNPFTLSPDDLLTTTARGFDDLAQSYSFGDTYRIGANAFNALRLAVNRSAIALKGAEFFSASDVGINAFSYVPKSMVLAVTSAFGIGSNTPGTFRTTSYQISDDVSVVRGFHQIFFGANLVHGRSNSNANSNSAGSYAFNGTFTGLGLSDFLLGQLNSFTQSAPNALYIKQSFVGLYAQDSWKAVPRITINYGLRWEPFLPQVSTNGRVYNFDIERFRPGIKSTVFRNAPAGFYYPGDPGFPDKSGINKRWLSFAPRVGLAWDVNGDGRTSVRASYAMAYNYLPLQWRINAGFAPPWGTAVTINGPPGGLDNPWQGFGNPFPLKFDQNALFPLFGSYESTPYNIRMPYVPSWNLSIQRQVKTDWLVSATYLGSQVVHMWVQKPLNPGVYIPGGSCTLNGVTYNPCSSAINVNQRRRLNLERPQDSIGILDEFDAGGTQSYHGLLLSVQRRAARRITVSGNYTWSHCIGDNGDTNGFGPAFGASYVDPNNRDFDRGNCDSDRRHIFNLAAIAETPQFANPGLRAALGGWRVAGIYIKSTGSFLTVTSGVDRALTGIAGQRVDVVLTDPYGDKSGRTLTSYLNPAAFALPALGALGNMGRANVQGPGTWQFDAALSKLFQIGENQKLEFRAEAYNVTNSFRPGNPNTSLLSSVFGRITTALEPRVMQFALKYTF